MILLPDNLAPQIRDALSSCMTKESPEAALLDLAQGSREVFGAEDAILCLRFEDERPTDDLIHVGGRYCKPDSVLAEKIAHQWRVSELDSQIRRDLKNRYSAVSYSAFSWPYTALRVLSPEQEVLFALPQGYAFLLPINSRMTVRLGEYVPFSGYLVLLFEGFPQFTDIMLNFLISLPQLMSEMASLFSNERRCRRIVDLQKYIDESARFLSLTKEFAAEVREGKLKSARAMEPDVSEARNQLMHSTKVLELLYGSASHLESLEAVRTGVDCLLDYVHASFVGKCRSDGVVLEKNVFGDALELYLDPELFSLALGVLIDCARSLSSSGGRVCLRAEVTTAREIVFTVRAFHLRQVEFDREIHTATFSLAKAIFESHKGCLEIDSNAEVFITRVRLPWSLVATTESHLADKV